MVSPGLSSVPAKSEPIITQSRARGDGLGHVAGVLDAAVGNDGDVAVAHGARGFGDGGDLRNACAGNDARGADGAGSDTDLDAVRASLAPARKLRRMCDVAGHEIDLRELRLDLPDRFNHACGVPVRAVDGEHVDLGLHQSPARARGSRR